MHIVQRGGETLGDIKKLMDIILSDEKLNANESIASRLYSDEPILHSAAQLQNYTPPKYRELRAVAAEGARFGWTDAEIFYRQGKLMENFEDDYKYRGEFIHYYPTYRVMSDQQKRGYFSWRTKVRAGDICLTSLSFAYVYIFELLCGIGVENGQAGYDALQNFRRAYRALDPRIERHMQQWLHDYVIFHGLDRGLLENAEALAFDASLQCLRSPAEQTDEALFSAICALASYSPERSRFCKEHPAAVRTVTVRVWRTYAAHYDKNCKNSLCDTLFGHIYEGPYRMFEAAVFHDRVQYENFFYEVDALERYSCQKGRWRCTRYCGTRSRSTELGAILKTIDCIMRQKYHDPHALKPGKVTKMLQKMIEREVDLVRADEQRRAVPKVEIDLSLLSSIRHAAAETREKLLTEEETEPEEVVPVQSALPAQSAAPVQNFAPTQDAAGLSPLQRQFLLMLLQNGDWAGLAREAHQLPAVLVDGINEALFAVFADTCIVWEGDMPLVLDDYSDELKGLILS